MSDYIADPTNPIARKTHRCIYCYGPIPVGEKHWHQRARYDGAWQTNRYHDECWQDISEWGDEEFTPGCVDMPPRIAALAAQQPTKDTP